MSDTWYSSLFPTEETRKAHSNYWRCQSVAYANYKRYDSKFSLPDSNSSVDKVDGLKRLEEEKGCLEILPNLQAIIWELHQREEKAKVEYDEAFNGSYESLLKNSLETFKPDDQTLREYKRVKSVVDEYLEKRKQSVIANDVMRGWEIKQRLRHMLDWNIRYDLWRIENQSLLFAGYATILSVPVGIAIGR